MIFVLVHGAWHGSWCWSRLLPFLTSKGHKVSTISLTGLGEKAHLASPDIGLENHVKDVICHLELYDLKNVILVGHSYSGFVITVAANYVKHRLNSLIYVDAFIPQNGLSLLNLIGSDFATLLSEQAARCGDGWLLPPLPCEQYGIIESEDLDWASPRLTPQPFKTFTDPVHLENDQTKLPCAYIRCTEPPTLLFDAFAEYAQREKWVYRELKSGHDAMITAPKMLADTLLEVSSL